MTQALNIRLTSGRPTARRWTSAGRAASAAVTTLVLGLLLMWTSASTAEPTTPAAVIGPGQTLPALDLNDQHERPGKLGADTRLLIFAPDRAGSDLAHPVLEDLGGEALSQAGVRYVADISAMPALVTRMFALPKMRDYGYPILLAREAAATAPLPRRPEALTLIELDGGRVTAVHYAATEEALRDALAPLLTP